MASSPTVKEVAKAIDTYFQAPTLPLPDDLTALIYTFLDKFAASDKREEIGLNLDLQSIYDKNVADHPEKYAAFLVLLRQFLPLNRDPMRLLLWWDKLMEPVLGAIGHQKGLANEALNNAVALSTLDSDDEAQQTDTGLNPFADGLMKRWMDVYHLIHEACDETAEFRVKMIREALTQVGKKNPKKFMSALNGFILKRETRNAALTLLTEFIRSQPPHLHLVLQTPLFGNILQSLQNDSSTTTVALALVALNMLLPYIPSSLIPFLPTLFNIYARLLFWDRDKSFLLVHTEQDLEMEAPGQTSTSWEESLINPDNDAYSIPHLSEYFTLLYGLYPINFLDYIRKPHRYLRHANNAEDIDVQATEIRDRSGRFSKHHLLHPNFYNLTIESEKTDLTRWIKSEAHEVLADCMALSIVPDQAAEAGFGLSSPAQSLSLFARDGAERDSMSTALLSTSVTGDATSSRDSLSAHWRHTHSAAADAQIGPSSVPSVRRNSQSSHVSTRASGDGRPRDFAPDSPTLPPHLVQSPSHTQLQDMIQSNKVIKSGLHQSHGNESALSLTLSHQDSIPEKASMHISPPQRITNMPIVSTTDLNDKLSQVYHQNLLLRNDLQFERYIKEQHMAHIGELRRKQLREEATEAETQNLVMAARNMRHRLEEAKLSEGRIKKESEHRRNMSKKWETDLAAKLKTLREEQKKWATSRDDLERELAKVQAECESLRGVVLEADERKLKAEQALQAIDINADEIERLRSEVARLSVSERQFQGKERSMQIAIEEADLVKARAEQLSIDLEARDEQLRQARHLYEAQIVVLNTKLAEAQRNSPSEAQSHVATVFESQLAASVAKASEIQKQYSALMKKYTVLQSSLLDIQADMAEKKARVDRAKAFDPDAEASPSTSPVDIRSRSHRGFPEQDVLEGSPGAGGLQRPSTPPDSRPADATGAGKNSPERYYGRGGVQNTIRKERKDKDDKEKKEKKPSGMQRIRGFV